MGLDRSSRKSERKPTQRIALGVAALLLVAAASPAQVVSEDERIWDAVVRHRDELIRVTAEPFHVRWEGADLCLRPSSLSHSPHGEHWIHVYVSPGAREAMTTGKGTYPEGTILLKQKFRDPEATRTDFYTGMRKREPGYHPQLGDWEFFTLDATGTTVTARGRIESCSECHSGFSATDFVARSYMASRPEPPG